MAMTPEERRRRIRENEEGGVRGSTPGQTMLGSALAAPFTLRGAATTIPAVAGAALDVNKSISAPPTNPVGRAVYDMVTPPRQTTSPPTASQSPAPAPSSIDKKVLLRQLQQQQEMDMIALRRPGADKFAVQDQLRERGRQIAALNNEVGPRGIPMGPEEKAAMIARGTEQSALATEQARRKEAATPSRADYARQVQGEYDRSATQSRLGLADQPNRFARLEDLAGAGSASRYESRRGAIEERETGLARSMGGEAGAQPRMTDEQIATRLKQLSDEEALARRERMANPDVAGARAEEGIQNAEVRRRLGADAIARAEDDRAFERQRRQAMRDAELVGIASAAQGGIAARDQIAQAEEGAGMRTREREIVASGFRDMTEFNTQADAVISGMGSLSGYSNPFGLGVFQDEGAIQTRANALLGRLEQTSPQTRARLAKELLTRIELDQVDILNSEEPIVRAFLNRLRELAQ